MSRQDAIKTSKKRVLRLVRHYLKQQSPGGYSLTVPDDGVMYVSDGVDEAHERWYVVVKPQPASIADKRPRELQEIFSDVERQMTKKHRITVFLMSALPVI